MAEAAGYPNDTPPVAEVDEAGKPQPNGDTEVVSGAGGGNAVSDAADAADVGATDAPSESWREERERLLEDIQTLQARCQKLARAAEAAKVKKVDAQTQTDCSGEAGAGNADEATDAASQLNVISQRMLRIPKDEATQLQGIEALFAEQTQVDGLHTNSPGALRNCLEAAVAIFSNHNTNAPLVLKASQYLSVLLAEPTAGEHLPVALLFQAAQEIAQIGSVLLAAEGTNNAAWAGDASSQTKLLTWLVSVLTHLLPCLSSRLREREHSEAFVRLFFSNITGRLLASTEFASEALILKCIQLLPLLPPELWIQKACVDSHTVHGLALARHRAGGGSKSAVEAPLPKAVQAAVRWAFSGNLELSVKALEDMFVSDAFICVEVLDALREVEKKQRGAFVKLDDEFGVVGKVLRLWSFHERSALEDAAPAKSPSREVLQKISSLLSALLLKLPPQRLVQRMQEFEETDILQRIALATIHSSAQLRLQIAVNYAENGVCDVVIQNVRALLDRYKPEEQTSVSAEAALRLLRDERLPADAWPYIRYCLEICIHVLSHWSATRASLQLGLPGRGNADPSAKTDVMDASAAPLLLAQGGLVDVLAEIIDPGGAGVELSMKPPQEVVQQANETLQALFDKNGHICLFCMQHFQDVKQMVSLGCDSLSTDPLAEFPEMQEQAVEELAAAFERHGVQEEKLARKILKALCVLFESSYNLVAWFLRTHPLSSLTQMQSIDVHVEAVRAVSHAPYWSSDDAPLLPVCVALITEMILSSIEGLGPGDDARPSAGRRVLDLTEAEELVAASVAAVLHLLLIDPVPPTVLDSLSESLGKGAGDDEAGGEKAGSEQAVGALMRVMQVFPGSDRVQMSCQHLLTSLLGE
eukprot:TRINITY_DN8648_c0_g3_i1.p1 TRINITY_DN8648_c0_g3~~TRINITY_DN8648_c0_g3_i1.p1  ORF type:complete len:872 (+),score=201.47 TRINITY_DN8648_c0_g3_i1:96-2711(+)